MKNKILMLFMFLTTLAFGQKATFKIKYSEQLAVFVFLEHLSENYPENTFKTKFQNSKYCTEKYKNSITKFEHLRLDYSYPYDDFPFGSKKTVQTQDLLKKNLIETENFADFKVRSIGIIPSSVLVELVQCMQDFVPLYNELIYNPNKEKFEKQLAEITKYAAENNIQEHFSTGLLFYNSSWDNAIPFEIAFYPLPDSNGFTAQAFCNNFISAIQTDQLSYKDLFSVMMHETFHIIYDEQSLGVKKAIDSYFKENKSKCSNYAYQLMNEALATALGNGYVYEKLDGKLDSGDWYNKKYINLMAKQIYPLVKEYIHEKKSMDKNFIDNYIRIYEENFPNWVNELDHIMTYRYVMSENDEDFGAIRKMFRYRSRSEYETEITENSLEKMKKSPLTKVIIISKKSSEKIKLIKNKFPELKDLKLNADKEFAYKVLLADKSQLIVLNQKKSTIETLIKSLK